MTTADGELGRAGSARPSPLLLVSAGLVLAWNAAAGPHPWDAGELALAAVRLGGSHAPGQPLHALLGWAATHLVPLGPMPWRLSILSVLLASVAAYAAGAIAGELFSTPAPASRFRAALVVNATALAVLLCPPVMRQAARPEVYALALSLFALGAWALVRWAKARDGSLGMLLCGALAGGLCVGVHPPHALGLMLFGLALVAAWRRDALRSPASVAGAFVFFLLGASVLVYLPLRARAGAPMWGEPSTVEGFVAYVTARAYRPNMPGPGAVGGGGSPFVVAARMVIWDGGLVPALAALGALAALLVRRVRGAPPSAELSAASVLAGAALLVLLSATLFTPDPRIPDHAAYLAPAVLVTIASGALALHGLTRTRARLGAAGLALLAVVPTALPELPTRAVSDLPALESFAFALLDAPPPRALALVRTDFVAATWMMDSAVDRTRPDVAAFAEGLSTSSWHWRSLAGHPACPDGVPSRVGDGPGPEPWIRGLVSRASSAVPISAEDHDDISRLGWVDGAYVRTPPPGASAEHALRATGGSGERTLPLVAATLAWAAAGDHDVAAEIVRAAVITRAERLFVRGEVEAAREAILAGVAPLPPASLEPLTLLDGPGLRPLVPVVSDPSALYSSAEDAVRLGATMLHAAGRRASASALLEAQLNRGDTRAMLQLAWLLLSDGATTQARDLADLFVATSPERAEEARSLVEAIARRPP